MAAPTALVTNCAACIFGAVSSSILTYTSHVIETITVSVTPHVTVFTNGSQTTSYQSNTITEAVAVGTGTLPSASAWPTYADESDITWTVGNVTLTYPTSYVQYLGFAGAPATSDDGSVCAQQTDATDVQLPLSTDAASFIYPLTNATVAMPLPTNLLAYLDGLATVSLQFDGGALTSCVPYAAVSVLRRHLPSTHQKNANPTSKRFGGPRRQGSQQPLVTLAPNAVNGTLDKRQYGSGSGYGTGTAPETQAPPSSASESTAAEASSVESNPENIHSTAFVISPITGRAIVTTESASSSASPTPQPAGPASPTSSPSTSDNGGQSSNGGSGDTDSNGGAQSNDSGNGQSNGSGSGESSDNGAGQSGSGSGSGSGSDSSGGQSSAAADNLPSTTKANSGPDISNLIGHIGSLAASASVTPAAAGSSPQVSNLLGNIGSVAAAQAATQAGAGSQPTDQQDQAQQTTQAAAGAQSTVQQGQNAQQTTQAGAPGTQPVFSAGSTVVSPQSNGQYNYGTQALTPGSTITAGSGSSAQLIALQTSGGSTELVVGGSTYAGSPGVGQTAVASPGRSSMLVTAGGHTFAAVQHAGSVVVADGSSTATIAPGAAATFEGQVLSVLSSGGSLLVGSSIVALGVTSPPGTALQALITASGHTFTAIHAGSSMVLEDASSTIAIKDGSTAIFEGQSVSVATDGSNVVVDGSQTLKLAAASTSTSTGLAGYIHSGLNVGGATASSAGSAPSAVATSDAGKLSQLLWSSLISVAAVGFLIAL